MRAITKNVKSRLKLNDLKLSNNRPYDNRYFSFVDLKKSLLMWSLYELRTICGSKDIK